MGINMKVLVTGATGFLGSHIVEQLQCQGWQVRCLVRASSDIRFLCTLSQVELMVGDLTDTEILEQSLTGVDAVIHCAALTKAKNPSEFYQVNVQGTVALLEAAKKFQDTLQRIVLVSTLAAAGPAAPGRPHRPDSPNSAQPVSHYGRSKLLAEQKAAEFTDLLPITILRFPMIYGPRDKEILPIFKAAKWGCCVFPTKRENGLSVIYASDAAAAVIKALKQSVASGSCYYIDDGHIRSWQEMLAEVKSALGVPYSVQITMPRLVMQSVAFMVEQYGRIRRKSVMLTRDKLNELYQPFWTCDSTDAQRDLAWQPQVSWAEGVKLTCQWYEQAEWM